MSHLVSFSDNKGVKGILAVQLGILEETIVVGAFDGRFCNIGHFLVLDHKNGSQFFAAEFVDAFNNSAHQIILPIIFM